MQFLKEPSHDSFASQLLLARHHKFARKEHASEDGCGRSAAQRLRDQVRTIPSLEMTCQGFLSAFLPNVIFCFCNSLRENPNGVAPSMLLHVAVAHVVLLSFATRRLQIALERLGQCCFMSCGSLLASRNGVAGQAARKPQSVGEVGHVWNTSSSSYGSYGP